MLPKSKEYVDCTLLVFFFKKKYGIAVSVKLLSAGNRRKPN
jgi:hypothetical protein